MNGTRNLRNSTNKEMQSYSGYEIFQGDHKLCLLFCFLFFFLTENITHLRCPYLQSLFRLYSNKVAEA